MASFSYLASFVNGGGVLLQASSTAVVNDFCSAAEPTALYYIKSREVPPAQLEEMQNVAQHIADREVTPSMAVVIKGLLEGQKQSEKGDEARLLTASASASGSAIASASSSAGGRKLLQLGGAHDALEEKAVQQQEEESLAVRALREAVVSKYLTPSLPLTDFLTNVARCKLTSSTAHEQSRGTNTVRAQMEDATSALADLSDAVEAAKGSECASAHPAAKKLIDGLEAQATTTASLANNVRAGAQCTPLHALWVEVIEHEVCDVGLKAVKKQESCAWAVTVLTVLCAILAMSAYRNWGPDAPYMVKPAAPTANALHAAVDDYARNNQDDDFHGGGGLTRNKHHAGAMT